MSINREALEKARNQVRRLAEGTGSSRRSASDIEAERKPRKPGQRSSAARRLSSMQSRRDHLSSGAICGTNSGLEPTKAIAAPPVPRASLTPSEYQNPPVELEQELGERWEHLIHRGSASQPVFWLVLPYRLDRARSLRNKGIRAHKRPIGQHRQAQSRDPHAQLPAPYRWDLCSCQHVSSLGLHARSRLVAEYPCQGSCASVGRPDISSESARGAAR